MGLGFLQLILDEQPFILCQEFKVGFHRPHCTWGIFTTVLERYCLSLSLTHTHTYTHSVQQQPYSSGPYLGLGVGLVWYVMWWWATVSWRCAVHQFPQWTPTPAASFSWDQPSCPKPLTRVSQHDCQRTSRAICMRSCMCARVCVCVGVCGCVCVCVQVRICQCSTECDLFSTICSLLTKCLQKENYLNVLTVDAPKCLCEPKAFLWCRKRWNFNWPHHVCFWDSINLLPVW